MDQWVNPAGGIAGLSFAALLALRHRVPDGTLLDAMELAQLLPKRPCRVRRAAWGLCEELQHDLLHGQGQAP